MCVVWCRGKGKASLPRHLNWLISSFRTEGISLGPLTSGASSLALTVWAFVPLAMPRLPAYYRWKNGACSTTKPARVLRFKPSAAGFSTARSAMRMAYMNGVSVTVGQSAESAREPNAKMAYLDMLYALPVAILFGFTVGWQKFFGVWICTTAVFFIVSIRWDLRRHVWFWLTIGIALLLQTPFVVLVPWSKMRTHFEAMPFALLDYFLVYGCVKLAERLMTRDAS